MENRNNTYIFVSLSMDLRGLPVEILALPECYISDEVSSASLFKHSAIKHRVHFLNVFYFRRAQRHSKEKPQHLDSMQFLLHARRSTSYITSNSIIVRKQELKSFAKKWQGFEFLFVRYGFNFSHSSVICRLASKFFLVRLFDRQSECKGRPFSISIIFCPHSAAMGLDYTI